MSDVVFRYGLFGAGRCGCVHGEILIGQGQRLVALGDENPSALASAVERLGVQGAATFADASSMAKHGTLDAVVISSHTKDHARDAEPFVRAGIPVYLEKPLTADLSEGFSFVKRIGVEKNLLQIGLQRRFDEALVYAKQLLDEKCVGEIREIRSILRDQHPPPATYSSRGLIIDMGIHVADEVLWLTGEFPCTVWAKTFQMTELPGRCAEFQPRFQRAFEIAHSQFRDRVREKTNFAVTQIDVLNAQVAVEAAHRSAVNGGRDYVVARSENLDEYERLCQDHKLFD